jgi:hypothetical protein
LRFLNSAANSSDHNNPLTPRCSSSEKKKFSPLPPSPGKRFSNWPKNRSAYSLPDIGCIGLSDQSMVSGVTLPSSSMRSTMPRSSG